MIEPKRLTQELKRPIALSECDQVVINSRVRPRCVNRIRAAYTVPRASFGSRRGPAAVITDDRHSSRAVGMGPGVRDRREGARFGVHSHRCRRRVEVIIRRPVCLQLGSDVVVFCTRRTRESRRRRLASSPFVEIALARHIQLHADLSSDSDASYGRFLALHRTHSGREFTGFSEALLAGCESYKPSLRRNALKAMAADRWWQRESIGSGEIFESAIAFIELSGAGLQTHNNLGENPGH